MQQSTQQERAVKKKQDSFKKYDFQKCKIHRKATSFGQPMPKQIICQCCFKNSNKKQIGINFSIQQLFYLGPLIPQYFLTLKISISILLILICVYGIPAIIINYISNSCRKSISLDCSNLFFVDFSFVNSFGNQSNLLIQTILASIGVLFSIIATLIGKFLIQKLRRKCRQKYCFENDYSVFIRFQNSEINEQFLLQNLQTWWKNQKQQEKNLVSILKCFYPVFSDQKINQMCQYKKQSQSLKNQELQKLLSFLDYPLIKKIIFSYNIQKFSEIKQKIQNLEKIVKKIQEVNNHRQLKDKQIQTLKVVLEQLSILQSQNQLSNYLQLTNKCILIFQFQPLSKYFLQKFNSRFCGSKPIFFNLNFKTIQRAPTPQEINWQNHHLLLYQHKFKPRFCSVLIFLMLISISLGGIAGLLIFWRNQLQNNSSIMQNIFAPLLAIMIRIINLIGKPIISWTTSIEKRPFKTQIYKTQFIRLIIFQFLTQGFILGIIYCLIGIQSIWIQSGFLDTLFYLFLFHMFLRPLTKFVNFGLIIQLISHHLIEQYSNQQMSQKQANQAYQKYQFQLSSSSSWIAHILILSGFMSGLAPFSLIIGFICLLIEYFIQKLYLIKFCKQPVNVSEQFSSYMYKMISLSPISVSFGNLWCIVLNIVNNLNSSKYSLELIINLSIFFISLIIIFVFYQKSIIFANSTQKKQQYNSNLQNQISSERSNQFKLLLKNENNQQVKASIFKVQNSKSNLYQNSYNFVQKKFTHKYQKVYPIPHQYLLKSGYKQISATYRQKMQIIQELNTMSKTLEQSLKDRLFSQKRKGAILTPRVTHRQVQVVDDNIYFEYEKKVTMQKPYFRVKIPPLYKKSQEAPESKNVSMEYQLFKSKSVNSLQSSSKRQAKIDEFDQGNQSQLKRITSIFGQDQENLKSIVKNKIKQSIQKVNNN